MFWNFSLSTKHHAIDPQQMVPKHLEHLKFCLKYVGCVQNGLSYVQKFMRCR